MRRLPNAGFAITEEGPNVEPICEQLLSVPSTVTSDVEDRNVQAASAGVKPPCEDAL